MSSSTMLDFGGTQKQGFKDFTAQRNRNFESSLPRSNVWKCRLYGLSMQKSLSGYYRLLPTSADIIGYEAGISIAAHHVADGSGDGGLACGEVPGGWEMIADYGA
jgi:hypothetical protein